MPSTRKQKAREKRSRQSEVMSDVEILDLMLRNYQESVQVRDGNLSDADFHLDLKTSTDTTRQSTDGNQ